AAWIEGATETTALWDIGAVLSTVAAAAGDILIRDVLLQLPPGYDLLDGVHRGEPRGSRRRERGFDVAEGVAWTQPPRQVAGLGGCLLATADAQAGDGQPELAR
ncbi:hypothetical protein ACFVY6_16980, partial [Streptomyces virginiae]